MKIINFTQAQKYLSEHIPQQPSALFTGGAGLQRMRYLLALLGDPQNKIKVVHIAGTSGKSSTAFLASKLLQSAGKKTGLYISPHITDVRERIRIDDKIISREKFLTYLHYLQPFIEKTENTKFGSPTYFEILTALAFTAFAKEQVVYGVIETGIGGLYDGTNVVEEKNKIAIITKLGLDHTDILGKTITDIAFQKAGIIQKENVVISCTQSDTAEKVLEETARKNQAQLIFIREGMSFSNVKESNQETNFTFNYAERTLQNIKLRLLGKYQAENCSLALAVLFFLAERDGFIIHEQNVKDTLEGVSFPGRMSIYSTWGKTLVVDGAHNEQKMTFFLESLSQLFPRQSFHFLLAFMNTKDHIPMLKLIVPLAKSITVTTFSSESQDWYHTSFAASEIAESLKQLHFNNTAVISEPKQALEHMAQFTDSNKIVITGSLYLISAIYPELEKL